MKKVGIFIIIGLVTAIVLTASVSKADMGQRLNYQGRVTDTNGVPIADGNYSMTFAIYNDVSAGTLLWDQTIATVAVTDGLFSVELGSTSDPLSGINWNQDVWIQLTVGATTYTPRQKLTGVVYALTVPEGSITAAKLADGATLSEIADDDGSGSGLDADLLDGQHGSYYMTAASDNWVNTTGDTMTGALNMTANILPTADSTYTLGDATHKWSGVSIASGALTDASVVLADLAGDSVNSSKIVDGSVATGDVAFNFVGSIDGVVNKGGNIDLLTGNTMLTITPSDASDNVTFTVNVGNIDHNSLANLTTGDPHTQYFNLSQSETVSGRPAFNGGTSGTDSPFTVDSTYVVASLNSDLLDGQHGAYYMAASTDNWVNTTGDTMTGALNMTANILPTADNTYTLGDATHEWAGVSIANGALTDASVILADLAADSVNSSKIVDSSVATGDVAFNFVGSIDGVVNKGGNIDLVTGNTMLTITPSDASDNVTFTVNVGNIDHNSLANLTTGDPHTQYFNLSQDETVAGRPAFNGGTSGTNSPFTVDSTYVVTNLNADLLDGQTGSYYQNADNINAGTLNVARYSAYSDLSNEGYLANAAGDIALNNGTVQATLNADLLDGQEGSYYMAASTDNWVNISGDTMTGRLGQSEFGFHAATKDNITTRTDSGFYQTSAATTANGWPQDTSDWYHLLTSTHNNDGNYYSMQFAGNFRNSTDIFYRATNGSGTTGWNRIWNAGNDGTGTGMDADLLDGNHSTAFAAASHSHSTLTRSTGLTGGNYNGSAAQTWAVSYGSSAGTAVQGNTTLTFTSSNGILVDGGTSVAKTLGSTNTLAISKASCQRVNITCVTGNVAAAVTECAAGYDTSAIGAVMNGNDTVYNPSLWPGNTNGCPTSPQLFCCPY